MTTPVESVKLNKNSTTIQKGKTEKLTAIVQPPEATNKTVTWESDKTSVATVSDGTVTGVAAGSANITVTTGDGAKTAKCTVKVTEPLTKATISGTPQVGQTLTANTTPTAATVSYKWKQSDAADGSYTDISRATAKTYVLTEAENGKFIKVEITGTGNYTGTVLSEATTQVAASGT